MSDEVAAPAFVEAFKEVFSPPSYRERCAFALGRVLGAMDLLKQTATTLRSNYSTNAETKSCCDLIDAAHTRTIEACEEAGFSTTLEKAKGATSAAHS